MNYLLGKYIAYATNDPKKYPKNPFFHEENDELREMSVQELERQAKYNTIKMGGVINDS